MERTQKAVASTFPRQNVHSRIFPRDLTCGGHDVENAVIIEITCGHIQRFAGFWRSVKVQRIAP